MSSFAARVGVLLTIAVVLTGWSASAQDRTTAPPAGAKSINVFNPVEGRIVVASAKPEGTAVKKGDLVCSLDPAPLNARLTTQETTILGAAAAYENAKLIREVADLAVNEYVEGTFKQDHEAALGEVALAQAGVRRAENRLDWSDRMFAVGYVSKAQNLGDKAAMQRAKLELDQAETKVKVLVEYTRDRTLKTLKSKVEEARSVELAKRVVFEREQAARKSLVSQLDACKVVAPADGRVHYTRPFGKGAVIQDGDVLFQIVTDGAPGTQ